MPTSLYYPLANPPALPTPPTPPTGATSPYTDEEIQGVVDSLIRSSIRRPYDTLGVRRTDVTFSDVQEAAAGVFLMYPRSPLYLLYLAGQQVREVFSTLTAALTALKAALRVLRKRSLPVKDVSSLVNAKVALFELEGVVSQGKTTDVTTLNAYKRFSSNLDRFLKAAGSNIKDNGAVVQTPEQARRSLSTLVNNLETEVVEYLRRIALLADGLNNFNSLGLAQLLSSTVITNARAKLAARADQMSALSETERLEVLREVILDVLGVKAAVKTFGSFPGVSSANSLTGNFMGFADATRPAVPASMTVPVTSDLDLVIGANKAGSTNWMDVWVDGAPTSGPPSQSFFFGESVYPQIVSAMVEPYSIVYGVNDNIELLIDGTTMVFHNFGVWGALTAQQVATELSPVLAPYGFTCEAHFSPLMYDDEVISSGNTISLAFGYFPDSSIVAGSSQVEFYYGSNASPTLRNVTSVTTSGGHVVSFVVDGAALVGASDNLIRVGTTKQWRIVPVNKVTAITGRRSIQAKADTSPYTETWMALGVYGSILGSSQATDADALVPQVNGGSTLVTCEAVVSVQHTGQFTSDMSDATLINTSFNTAGAGWALTITDGLNAGKYIIDSTTTTPGVYKLKKPLPAVNDGFSNPLTMNGTIGQNQYKVASRNTLATSAIAVKGPASGGTILGPLGPNAADTYYAKFSDGYKDLQEGDILEYYGLSTTVPDATLTVVQVFADGVFKLDTHFPVTISVPAGSQTTPFIRLVTGRVADFELLANTLITLLQSSDANPVSFFKDLNRFINPLIVNKNPTDSDIGAAESRVDDLWNALSPMDVAISGYNPTHVPQVDELVKAFKEKGTDRGLDLLLSCEFDIFFGLTQEEMSYAGAFQKAVRDVARNDLVVHKSNRLAQNVSPLRVNTESPDMEYSSIDLDKSPAVDPPVDVDRTTT